MEFKAHMKDTGERVAVPDAKRFAAYVQNCHFWFAVHRPVGSRLPVFVLSDWESGKKICDVSPLQIDSAPDDLVGAARLALQAMVDKHGAARVRSVLAGA